MICRDILTWENRKISMNMGIRRIFAAAAVSVLTAAVFAAVSPEACAQAQINTKKVKIGDFTQKTLKVVLSGNPMIDSVLQDEVSSGWRVSPYEFCTLDDFMSGRTNPDNYFMLLSKTRLGVESDPEIEFLTVVKGGKDAEKGIEEMLEVCAFPVRAAQMPGGREFDFMPAIIDIIQDYILKSMEDDRVGYAGLGKFACGISATSGMNLVMADGDISRNVSETVRSRASNAGIAFVDDDEADEIMSSGDMNSVVSYTVSPTNPGPDSYCYRMLIGAGDHRLYYFRRQYVGKDGDYGFRAAEISKLAAVRRK